MIRVQFGVYPATVENLAWSCPAMPALESYLKIATESLHLMSTDPWPDQTAARALAKRLGGVITDEGTPPPQDAVPGRVY